MSRVHGKLTMWVAFCCLLSMLWVLPAVTQDQSSSSQNSTGNDQTSSTTKVNKKKKKTKKTKGETTTAATETSGDTSNTPATNAARKTSMQSSGNATSNSDIADAKSSGKVWVNLDSGIYHKGGRWYGKTKNGKFMTEKEAKAAGYKPAQRD